MNCPNCLDISMQQSEDFVCDRCLEHMAVWYCLRCDILFCDECGIECISPKRQVAVDRARAEYGDIRPCDEKSWEECFTEEEDVGRCFWFNDQSGFTHMIIMEEG